MRITERTQYILGIALYACYFYEQHAAILTITFLETLLIPIGFFYEGTRFHQFSFILGFIIQSATYIFRTPPLALTIVDLILLLISIAKMLIFGEANLNRIKLRGPYEVGYREFRTQKCGNLCSVYYPIEKEEYKRKINTSNPEWFRHGDKTVLGMARASIGYGRKGEHMPLWMFRHLLHVKINVAQNSEIAPEFISGKPLIPIVYCHGLCSNRTMHSGTCRDFASHGYIVFAIDHKDGTSLYHENEDGTGITFDNSMVAYDLEYRKSLQKIRENEIIELINEIQLNEQLMTGKLGFQNGVNLDLNRLVMGGHSFGGITAISVTNMDKRVKACITLDPWFYAYHNEILKDQFKLNVPFAQASSAHFHGSCDEHFPSSECLQKLLTTNTDHRVESLIVNHTVHLHQCDLASIIPFEMFMTGGIWPETTIFQTNTSYIIMSQVLISFLNRIGFNNSYDSARVEGYMDEIKAYWLQYEKKYYPQTYNPPDIENS